MALVCRVLVVLVVLAGTLSGHGLASGTEEGPRTQPALKAPTSTPTPPPAAAGDGDAAAASAAQARACPAATPEIGWREDPLWQWKRVVGALQEYRADEAAAGVERPRFVPHPTARLWVIRDALTGAECDTLISSLEAHAVTKPKEPDWCLPKERLAALEEAGAFGGEEIPRDAKASRTDTGELCVRGSLSHQHLASRPDLARSLSAFVPDGVDATADAVGRRLANLLRLSRHHAYHKQLLRYESGVSYERHTDCGGLENERAVTVLVYLDTLPADAGGETLFSDLELKVSVARGTAVVWSNLDEHGRCDPKMAHASLPLNNGHTKYALQQWFHAAPFPLVPHVKERVVCDASGSCREYVNPWEERQSMKSIQLGNMAVMAAHQRLKKAGRSGDEAAALAAEAEAAAQDDGSGYVETEDGELHPVNALRWYRTAVEERPSSGWARSMVAYQLGRLGRPRDAVAAWRALLADHPYFTRGRIALANVLHVLGDQDGAGECLRAVLQLDPEHLDALMMDAGIKEEAGDLEGALANVRRAAAISKRDRNMPMARGRLDHERRRLERALRAADADAASGVAEPASAQALHGATPTTAENESAGEL